MNCQLPPLTKTMVNNHLSHLIPGPGPWFGPEQSVQQLILSVKQGVCVRFSVQLNTAISKGYSFCTGHQRCLEALPWPATRTTAAYNQQLLHYTQFNIALGWSSPWMTTTSPTKILWAWDLLLYWECISRSLIRYSFLSPSLPGLADGSAEILRLVYRFDFFGLWALWAWSIS